MTKNLFDFDMQETPGDYVFFKFFEAVIAFLTVTTTWEWVHYFPRFGTVVAPTGLANYLDVKFMFDAKVGLAIFVTLSVSLLAGFVGRLRFGYAIAILLFHLLYVTRFSQGKVGHGSYLIGMALLSLAVATIMFRCGAHMRKFALGMLLFFSGIGYMSSALCKLIATGWHWVDGRHLWLWIAERGTDVFSTTGHYQPNAWQAQILAYYWLATLLLTLGLLSELGGFLLWFKKTRAAITVCLIALHLGVMFSMNIHFERFLYVLVMIGFSWAKVINEMLDRMPSQWALKRWALRFSEGGTMGALHV